MNTRHVICPGYGWSKQLSVENDKSQLTVNRKPSRRVPPNLEYHERQNDLSSSWCQTSALALSSKTERGNNTCYWVRRKCPLNHYVAFSADIPRKCGQGTKCPRQSVNIPWLVRFLGSSSPDAHLPGTRHHSLRRPGWESAEESILKDRDPTTSARRTSR